MANQTKKVLIIDDDCKNIFALKAVLKTKNYTCVSASTAEQGFKILNKDKDIGIVLMDMMMPDMDGYQAIQTMKKDADLHAFPVIAVTAQAMLGDKERCINAGAVGYVSKPVNIDELLRQIKNFI